MVLIKTIDETLDALISGEDSTNHEYDEERVLVSQMSKIVDINLVYKVLAKLNKPIEELTNEEISLCSKVIWNGLKLELEEILPADDLSNELEREFETKDKLPSKRIANIQNILITYFIENLKNKLNNGLDKEIIEDNILDYQNLLLTPESTLLNDKEGNNLGLDSSLKFFDIKKKELKSYVETVGKKSVK